MPDNYYHIRAHWHAVFRIAHSFSSFSACITIHHAHLHNQCHWNAHSNANLPVCHSALIMSNQHPYHNTNTSTTHPSLSTASACMMDSSAIPFVTQASESSEDEEEPIFQDPPHGSRSISHGPTLSTSQSSQQEVSCPVWALWF